MHQTIEGSVIVITGASSGIGRQTALLAADRGARVVLAARNVVALMEVAAECERRGGRALAVPTDVSQESEVLHLADQVVRRFGRIDAWVNCAAVLSFGKVEQTPAKIFDRVIQTNLFGCIYGARAVLPHFRRQGAGVLINVASGNGRLPVPYASAYATSKFALRGFSHSLRLELRDSPGIHVCSILPASIDTPIFQHAANFLGRAARPVPPVYSPELAARTILRCIEKPRREAYVGSAVKWMSRLHSVLPGLAERIYARTLEKKQFFQDRPIGPTEGNVLHAVRGLSSVRGGWQLTSRWREVLPLAAGVSAAVGGIALAITRRGGEPEEQQAAIA